MSSAVPAADTRGPATAARFHMPLPLPLAGERGAGGGMCPLSAIDIIDVFGISASYPQMHPRPRAASTTPRGRRMQAFAAIFADAGQRSLPARLDWIAILRLPGSQARGEETGGAA